MYVSQICTHIMDSKKNHQPNDRGPSDLYHPDVTPKTKNRGSVDPNILLMEMARQACGLRVDQNRVSKKTYYTPVI